MDDPLARGLEELAEKYRLLDGISRGEPGRTRARRDAIRAVAERFPAAMREWDELPRAEIARRWGEVSAARALLAAGDRAGAMARLGQLENACLRYAADLHPLLREVLAVKRWLRGRAVDDPLTDEARARFGVDRATLARIADPPTGHLTDAIYEQIASLHGVTVTELKRSLFGPG